MVYIYVLVHGKCNVVLDESLFVRTLIYTFTLRTRGEALAVYGDLPALGYVGVFSSNRFPNTLHP